MDKPLLFIADKIDRDFPEYSEEEKLRFGLELTQVFSMALLHNKKDGVWQPCQPQGCNLCKQYIYPQE